MLKMALPLDLMLFLCQRCYLYRVFTEALVLKKLATFIVLALEFISFDSVLLNFLNRFLIFMVYVVAESNYENHL